MYKTALTKYIITGLILLSTTAHAIQPLYNKCEQPEITYKYAFFSVSDIRFSSPTSSSRTLNTGCDDYAILFEQHSPQATKYFRKSMYASTLTFMGGASYLFFGALAAVEAIADGQQGVDINEKAFEEHILYSLYGLALFAVSDYFHNRYLKKAIDTYNNDIHEQASVQLTPILQPNFVALRLSFPLSKGAFSTSP